MKAIRSITAEEENFRVEMEPNYGFGMIRRDPIEVVPVGSIVAAMFRVVGYDRDCDGSLMALLEQVDCNGETTGWDAKHLGLYPDVVVQLDSPNELHKMVKNV